MSGELRLASMFRAALERTRLTVGEVVNRAGFSSRKAAANCERLRALLDGKGLPPVEHIKRFAAVLGLSGDLVGLAVEADEQMFEVRRRKREARELERRRREREERLGGRVPGPPPQGWSEALARWARGEVW